jgi:hypothetical protein
MPDLSAAVIINRMVNLKRRGGLDREDFFKIWNQLRDLLFKTTEYQAFLKEVRARCNNMCADPDCNKRGKHVHHKVPVYSDPTKSVAVDNGTYLCLSCHRKQHKGMTITARPSKSVAVAH